MRSDALVKSGASPMPRHVERLRERQGVEVADRDHPSLVEKHERVLLRCVELRLDTPLRERECVARRRAHLWDAAKAERILEVAGSAFVPEIAPVEQGGQRGIAVQRTHVCRERLEVERRRKVERRAETQRIRERERGERGRERVVAEQREPLLRRELEAVEHAVRQVGVRGQIGHADRAEQPHRRHDARIQLRDEVLEQLESHAGRPARKAVCDEQELRAHDFRRCGIALADTMLEDQPPVELRELAWLDARPLAHSDTRRQPVDRCVACEGVLDDRPPGAYAIGDSGRELDGRAVSGDREQLLEREGVAAECDRHGG